MLRALYPLSVFEAPSTDRSTLIVQNESSNQEIIAEISSTATKTNEKGVRDSLKIALPQQLFDKTTEETIKRTKNPTIPEVKIKGNKICYEANKNIL